MPKMKRVNQQTQHILNASIKTNQTNMMKLNKTS